MNEGLKKFTVGFLLTVFTGASGIQALASQSSPAQKMSQTAAATEDQSKRISAVRAAKYANSLHLAYIKTSSGSVNNQAKTGVGALAARLNERTSVEPEGVVGLDIEKDPLVFFPFIYWPVTRDVEELSPYAQKKVQNYINNGGIIVFDLLDKSEKLSNSKALRRLLGGVNIKPLVKMDRDHTLAHTFYVIQGLPGSNRRSPVWIEAPGNDNSEDVSSVIISQSNWAGAWAGINLMPKSKEYEAAIRAGVNMVMFALTGGYKRDGLHAESIAARRETAKTAATDEPKEP
jgi:hypothetical protein